LFRRIIDSPWLYMTLAAALLGVALLSVLNAPPSLDLEEGSVEDIETLGDRDDLNVVFVVIDTLRADRLMPYGYKRPTSPVMNMIAERGIRFAHVESQSSWTKASMASLWTGLYPQRTGITLFAQALPTDAVMPAEVLKKGGFRTAGIWRNGWTANNFGFDQGFDLYVKPQRSRPDQKIRRNNPSAHPLQGTDWDITQSAIEYINGARDDRFFLYVHYMDVHQYLYADTSPDFGSSFSDIYDSSIHWVDQNVGMLYGTLREQGLLNRTLIVIVADHGEAFFEHGLEGHARNLYREVQEVPWIVGLPFALEQGIVVEPQVANIDVWPTILDLIGEPPLPDADGHSLVPLILDAAGVPGQDTEPLLGRTVFSQLDRSWGKPNLPPRPMSAMVKDSHRLVRPEFGSREVELYDHTSDPREKANIAGQGGDRLAAMQTELDAFLEQSPSWKAPEVEIDEMHTAQLRALGYMVPSNPRKKKEAADDEPAPDDPAEGQEAEKAE